MKKKRPHKFTAFCESNLWKFCTSYYFEICTIFSILFHYYLLCLQVVLTEIGMVPVCGQVYVEPVSPDDWEILVIDRVPTRTGTMGRHFPVREKSGKSQGKSHKILEN